MVEEWERDICFRAGLFGLVGVLERARCGCVCVCVGVLERVRSRWAGERLFSLEIRICEEAIGKAKKFILKLTEPNLFGKILKNNRKRLIRILFKNIAHNFNAFRFH